MFSKGSEDLFMKALNLLAALLVASFSLGGTRGSFGVAYTSLANTLLTKSWPTMDAMHDVFSLAPGGQHGFYGADRLSGLAHQEGDVTELGHGSQEAHVVRKTGLQSEKYIVVIGYSHVIVNYFALTLFSKMDVSE